MYVLVWSPAGIAGWEWMWIVLGLLLDGMNWAHLIQNRRNAPGYPSDNTASVTSPAAGGE